jgi:hypothetical protein
MPQTLFTPLLPLFVQHQPTEITVPFDYAENPFDAAQDISIPRGELMACQLSVRLAKYVCEQLGLDECRVKYLSDSTTPLWWNQG